MTMITRRQAISAIASISTAAGTGSALALPATSQPSAPPPVLATPAAREIPVQRVNRLASELARAMDDWMADLSIDGVPDYWIAHIHPSESCPFPIGFEHRRRADPQKIAELEAAFHAEWAALRAMEPALNAAEVRYMDLKGRRPVMAEMTPEEVERLRQTTVADVAKLPPSRGSVEHAEAMRAYNKADAAVRRKTGFGKLDNAYRKATHRTADAANALLSYPATTLDDLAAKVRVHRVWEFDGEDFNYIMEDVARVAGKGVV